MAEIRSGAACDVVFRRCDIEAMFSLPIITIIWPGTESFLNAGFGVGLIISALMAPVPLLGLTGWLVGHLVGWFVSATHLYPKKN